MIECKIRPQASQNSTRRKIVYRIERGRKHVVFFSRNDVLFSAGFCGSSLEKCSYRVDLGVAQFEELLFASIARRNRNHPVHVFALLKSITHKKSLNYKFKKNNLEVVNRCAFACKMEQVMFEIQHISNIISYATKQQLSICQEYVN